MGKTWSGKYSMRESHRLCFGNHCERLAERDIRHEEFVLRDLRLEGSKVKPLTTPGFKFDERELAVREIEVLLEATDDSRYSSCVMRLSYLSQDRADLGEPVKCLARSGAKPTPASEISRRLHTTCWVPST